MAVVEVVHRNYMILKNNDEVGGYFEKPPMVGYRRGKNLKDYLLHSKLRKNNSLAGTPKCDRNVCLTCNHINSDKMVVGRIL